MDEINVTIVDSIMGTGKTSAVFQMMKQHPEKNYIYCSPLLAELQRAIKETGFLRQPIRDDHTKSENFHHMLSQGQSVATTHSLFLRATAETAELIRQGEYTLILDEALNVVTPLTNFVNEDLQGVDDDTLQWLFQEGHIIVEPDTMRVRWTASSVRKYLFSDIETLANEGVLRCVDAGKSHTLLWVFPPEIFKAFKEVWVLTYQFKGTVLDSYLKANHITYKVVSVSQYPEGTYTFVPHKSDREQRRQLANLITIYDGPMNKIGGPTTNLLSANYLVNANSVIINKIACCLGTIRKSYAAKGKLMWTTTKKLSTGYYAKNSRAKPKSIEEIIEKKEKGVTFTHKLSKSEDRDAQINRCFVPCNAVATNDLRDRTTLAYLLNLYVNPQIEKYFAQIGYPINERQFALNTLIQWIWRSAIRDGEKIFLFLPSIRMRNLLTDWLCLTA